MHGMACIDRHSVVPSHNKSVKVHLYMGGFHFTSYWFVMEMGALMQVALIAASCCAGPIRSLVVVVVVACCCCIPYRLALMLALTFAPCVLTFAPCTLTFAPCAYGVSLLSTGATIPLAQMVASCH